MYHFPVPCQSQLYQTGQKTTKNQGSSGKTEEKAKFPRWISIWTFWVCLELVAGKSSISLCLLWPAFDRIIIGKLFDKTTNRTENWTATGKIHRYFCLFKGLRNKLKKKGPIFWVFFVLMFTFSSAVSLADVSSDFWQKYKFLISLLFLWENARETTQHKDKRNEIFHTTTIPDHLGIAKIILGQDEEKLTINIRI